MKKESKMSMKIEVKWRESEEKDALDTDLDLICEEERRRKGECNQRRRERLFHSSTWSEGIFLFTFSDLLNVKSCFQWIKSWRFVGTEERERNKDKRVTEDFSINWVREGQVMMMRNLFLLIKSFDSESRGWKHWACPEDGEWWGEKPK